MQQALIQRGLEPYISYEIARNAFKMISKEKQNPSQSTITTFDDLPSDVLLLLFEYFHVIELFCTFYNLNLFINRILGDKHLFLHADLTTNSSLNYFCSFIQSRIFSAQLKSMKLTSNWIEYRFYLKRFGSVQALTLIDINSDQVCTILREQQEQLQYLKLIYNRHMRHQLSAVIEIIRNKLQLPMLNTLIIDHDRDVHYFLSDQIRSLAALPNVVRLSAESEYRLTWMNSDLNKLSFVDLWKFYGLSHRFKRFNSTIPLEHWQRKEQRTQQRQQFNERRKQEMQRKTPKIQNQRKTESRRYN
ncbi:unnamed protein product [Didymodactylos carnosus]|uniref:F-box domain-containing protein n=1 Tax=Didymodactylos carnosus TaxID=1234261 RepID=A0A815H5C5_9BILA|nr:unnamed protein product [Didymodactylos carnosus]CAF1349451.1 unnamed protein product [Didymodactylos carnosus]CAF3849148.1 unnamed protein product [Didymodactylos carnosus]CAF4218136.1 unnamed protein product [Didymodactylos carnosus]